MVFGVFPDGLEPGGGCFNSPGGGFFLVGIGAASVDDPDYPRSLLPKTLSALSCANFDGLAQAKLVNAASALVRFFKLAVN